MSEFEENQGFEPRPLFDENEEISTIERGNILLFEGWINDDMLIQFFENLPEYDREAKSWPDLRKRKKWFRLREKLQPQIESGGSEDYNSAVRTLEDLYGFVS